jgi:hypothetical protein
LLPVIIGLTVFPHLLLPTGRLPGRRWRWLAWVSATWLLLAVVTGAFASGALLGVLGPIQNPLGIEGLTNIYLALLLFVSPPLQIAAAFSLFLRLRRAVGIERQQIKWFAYAAVATVGGGTLAYIIPAVVYTPTWFERAGFVLNVVFMPAIPVSVGIAILRYRLYDIDVIINRTLVYGSLTATLALVYFGGVVTADSFPGPHRRGAASPTRRRGLHPHDRRALQPAAPPHPGVYRQTFLQAQVRCREDARRLLRPIT